jgi:hypothetical protein
MRRVFFRGFAAVAVIVVLSVSVSAAPRERGKDKVPVITKLLRMVRSLGDGLTIPPAPTPRP